VLRHQLLSRQSSNVENVALDGPRKLLGILARDCPGIEFTAARTIEGVLRAKRFVCTSCVVA
jgi:hypothetical protein